MSDDLPNPALLPAGLREADRPPEPLFTPSTKAEVGHGETLTRPQPADTVGADLARQLEERTLAVYRAGAERAEALSAQVWMAQRRNTEANRAAETPPPPAARCATPR